MKKLPIIIALAISASILGSCNTTPTYTITWQNYDGSLLQSDTNVPKGTTPTYTSATPTREKDAQYTYTWSGWDKEIGPIVENTVYTATYSTTVNQYTITWKNYDDTVLKTENLPYGQTPSYTGTEPSKPSEGKYRYVFSGWETPLVPVTQDATYVAKFDSEQYIFTVNFNVNGATIGSLPSKDISAITKDVFTYDLKRNKKAFHGWEYNGTKVVDQYGTIIDSTIPLSEGMTFTAIFDDFINIHYTVTNPEGGTLYGVSTAKISDEYFSVKYTRNGTEGYTLIKDNAIMANNPDYTNASNFNVSFLGVGDYGYTNIYHGVLDYYFKATYTYGTRTCTLKSANPTAGLVNVEGSGMSDTNVMYYGFTCHSTVTALAKDKIEGVTFLGWYNTDTNELLCNDRTYTFKTAADNIHITAKWDYYVVTYNLNGGTNDPDNPSSYTSLDKVTLKPASKDHYTFTGWTYNGSSISEIDGSKLKTDITLVANFTPINYAINYVMNGGTNNEGNITTSNIESEAFTLLEPTKEDNLFKGWYSDEACTNKVTEIPANLDHDFTVYAAWYDLSDFNYTISGDDVTITGVKDSTKTSYVVPGCVTKIAENAFKDNTALETITLSEGLVTIGYEAFCGCTSLQSISFPNTLKTIDGLAFNSCNSLVSVTIPNNVTSLGVNSFAKCANLESAIIGSGISTLTYAFTDDPKLTSVTLKFGITKLGNHCLSANPALTTVSIPNTVTEIGADAFGGDSSLTNVYIPSSVTSIGDYAFDECSSLNEIYIPRDVSVMGEKVFNDCGPITVNCAIGAQPSGWSENWKTSNVTVNWGYSTI